MIFGMTHDARSRRATEKLHKRRHPRYVFAWWPLPLDDGRYVWLEWVGTRPRWVGTADECIEYWMPRDHEDAERRGV